MILVIDNYDSFTYNLVHLIGAAGWSVRVARNDAIDDAAAIAATPQAIVLSPGPGTPKDAGASLQIVQRAAAARIPVFGVCLGLQTIAQAFGGRIVRADTLMHGKTSEIEHHGDILFDTVPTSFTATRYHSLVAEEVSLPEILVPIARSAPDQDGPGEIMALRHAELPIAGVQFHPELKSTVERPHPLFVAFVNACLESQRAIFPETVKN